MNTNPLTPGLTAFFSGIGSFNIMPNPVAYIFSDQSTSPPYTEASNYGMATSVF